MKVILASTVTLRVRWRRRGAASVGSLLEGLSHFSYRESTKEVLLLLLTLVFKLTNQGIKINLSGPALRKIC